jgi:uncharacterized membrane protein YphA (DoxX/SURF4 family)
MGAIRSTAERTRRPASYIWAAVLSLLVGVLFIGVGLGVQLRAPERHIAGMQRTSDPVGAPPGALPAPCTCSGEAGSGASLVTKASALRSTRLR